jgi:ADP-ribose pyrophosphatase YjhB (NUDIX family)
MGKFLHRITENGRVYTLSWVGEAMFVPSRVYAIAFISPAEMLLVSGGSDDPNRYVPGGGIELGETAKEALRRELMEEADATIVALEAIGLQQIEDPQGSLTYQRFYWCRVNLADQVFPRAESTLRHVVSPADYLDTLCWGQSDPKAPLLLEKALAIEARYGAER